MATTTKKQPKPRPIDATEVHQDISMDLAHLVRSQIRANFRTNSRIRFKCGEVGARYDYNGDSHPTDIRDDNEVLNVFAEFPFEERKKALGGWHPDVLNTPLEKTLKELRGGVAMPGVRVVGLGRRPLTKPQSEFIRASSETFNDIHIWIPACMSKLDAMEQLDRMVSDIDFFWDEIVANSPDNE